MLPEIRKTRASQARETAAAEKNQQLNTVQTALQTDIATFTRRTAGSLKNMFSLQKSQAELERLRAGAELERQREEARKKKDDDKSLNDQFKDKFGFPIFGIGTMIAGISALAGAAVGLRGWEKKGLLALSRITRIGPTIVQGMTKLRNGVLGIFGLTAKGLIVKDAVSGRFMKAPSIVSQVSVALSQFRTRLLRVFGIGADGKLIPVRGPGGQLIKAGAFTRVMKVLLDSVSKIFQPIKAAGQLATKSLGGAFGGIMRAVGSLGGFAKLFGTILKPIGIVFSLFDGVKTFMNTEGSLFTKINEGIAAVLGDFVGAPLDLLKSGLSWVAKNLLGEDNFISKFLDSFSVEKLLKDIIATPGRILTGAIDKIIKPLLNGEIDVVGQNIVKIFRKMFDAIYGIVKGIVNFVAEKLGLDFRLGEDEVSKKERKLEEIKEKKIQLENKEKQLREDLEAGDFNVIQAQKKLAQVEEEYQEYLDGLADRGSVGQVSKIKRFEREMKRAEEKLAREQAKVQEKINALEEEKRKLLLEEKEALFDVKDFVSGSANYNPSGNGAAQGISAQMLYEQDPRLGGSAPMNVVTTDNGINVNNTMNDFGGAQRVEPASRYVYSEAVYP